VNQILHLKDEYFGFVYHTDRQIGRQQADYELNTHPRLGRGGRDREIQSSGGVGVCLEKKKERKNE
jgi:hypothetical protein